MRLQSAICPMLPVNSVLLTVTDRTIPILELESTFLGSSLMESESEFNRLLIGIKDIILCWYRNQNWNLTMCSGTGIEIDNKLESMVPEVSHHCSLLPVEVEVGVFN